MTQQLESRETFVIGPQHKEAEVHFIPFFYRNMDIFKNIFSVSLINYKTATMYQLFSFF